MNTKELIDKYLIYKHKANPMLYVVNGIYFIYVDIEDYFENLLSPSATEISLFEMKYNGDYFNILFREVSSQFDTVTGIGKLE